MKDPKTIDEQLQILIRRRLIINDQKFAKEFLNQVNYYRFSGYLKLFSKNDVFDGVTKFNDIVDIYNFDNKLRNLLSYFLGYIEVLIKTQLALTLSLKLGPIFYLDKENFLDEKIFIDLNEKINKNINDNINNNKNSNRLFVKHFEGTPLPIWVLVEILSFGNISRMFSNLTDFNKNQVCNNYLKISKEYLKNYLFVLSSLRNSCAHYVRIYGKKFEFTPKIYNKDKKILLDNGFDWSKNNNKLFICIFIMVKLMKSTNKKEELIADLNKLFNEYPNVDIRRIGFVKNWEIILNSIKI